MCIFGQKDLEPHIVNTEKIDQQYQQISYRFKTFPVAFENARMMNSATSLRK